MIPAPQHPSYAGPGRHLRWRLGFLRAQICHRPWWALKAALGWGPKVHWGKRVSFLSCVSVRGPGEIFLGDDSLFDSHATLFTHSKNARLIIGAQSYVNGTRFGCSQKIEIGERCILADARIMDTDFHSLSRDRFSKSAKPLEAPVILKSNVWLAAGTAVLKGVTIGEDSVVAFGSVVTKDIPAGKIYGGNPAKEIADLA